MVAPHKGVPEPRRPPPEIRNLRDEHIRRGLVHLDRMAIRGTISSGVTGRYLPPDDRATWRASLAELGTLALYALGFAGIGALGFTVWGLVQ